MQRKESGIATLPRSLGEALYDMKDSEFLRDVLGPHIFPEFIKSARTQWNDYRASVSEWELERYLHY